MTAMDGELLAKTKKASEKVSEDVHIFANDPSLAYYRIQEHIRKVLPAIAEKRYDVKQLQNNLLGHCYDMEYDMRAIKDLENADSIFKDLQDIIRRSIFLKQHLTYEVARTSSV